MRVWWRDGWSGSSLYIFMVGRGSGNINFFRILLTNGEIMKSSINEFQISFREKTTKIPAVKKKLNLLLYLKFEKIIYLFVLARCA